MNHLTETLKRMQQADPDALMRLYKRVFDGADGQLILQDLKNRCFEDMSTVQQNGPIDPYRTHINEGMRVVILHIQTLINSQPTTKQEGENA